MQLEPHPFRAADLELAVVLRTHGGDFTFRRVSLGGGDLVRALPYLLDADPARLRQLGREPPVQVTDEAFGLADRAFAAAYDQFPLADPEDWMGEDEFRSLVVDDPDFSDELRPLAYRAGDVGEVVGVLAGMAVFAGVLLGIGFPLNVRLGLNTPERQDTLPDHVFGVVFFSLACVLAVVSYRLVVRLFERRWTHRV